MKKTILGMLALSALLHGQELIGDWQGSLQVPSGRELRLVFKVSKGEGNALKGTMHSIDQGGQAIPLSSVTMQGSSVKMSVPGAGATYEGKLESDGSIAGNWTQGPMPFPLILKRATPQTAWQIPEPPPPPKPMAADASVEFEVATIKPSVPDQPGKGFGVRGRQFSTRNTSLSDLICFAYGVHAKQITGGPSWLSNDKYDLAAQPAAEGQPSEKQWKAMIQKLLKERFQLTFHREKKELGVYAIVLGKGGPKLTKSAGNAAGLPGLFFRGLGALNSTNATIADLANLMQTAVLDRPVIDQTGLTERWDFTLNWTPDEFQFGGMGVKVPPPTNNAAALPDLFTAMQEQLGLKFESTKAPAEILVIDRAEKPSEN